jgi:hypothetical protein
MTQQEQNFFEFPQSYEMEECFAPSAETIDISVSPFDVIKKMAESLGQKINEPKSGCNYCYGRGYTSRDSKTKAPIPCSCLFNADTKRQNEDVYKKTHHMSRAEKRIWERKLKKELQKQ